MRFVKPKKALGQHFLNDTSIAERIVESLSPSQNVLEIEKGLTQFGQAKSYLSFLGTPIRQVDSLINAEARVT